MNHLGSMTVAKVGSKCLPIPTLSKGTFIKTTNCSVILVILDLEHSFCLFDQKLLEVIVAFLAFHILFWTAPELFYVNC